MEFAAELKASLQEFTASGIVEVRENGGRVAPFAGMSWEVRGAGEKPLLHLWSEQFNLARRVLAITDHSERRLVLAVERFGRAKPDRLEFIRRDFERSAGELSRAEFRDRLARLLAEQFPDENPESLTVSPDLEHSLSGNYARGLLRPGSSWIALLAVPDGESADTADNSLALALLWLTRARQSNRRGTVGARCAWFFPRAPAAPWRAVSPHWRLAARSNCTSRTRRLNPWKKSIRGVLQI